MLLRPLLRPIAGWATPRRLNFGDTRLVPLPLPEFGRTGRAQIGSFKPRDCCRPDAGPHSEQPTRVGAGVPFVLVDLRPLVSVRLGGENGCLLRVLPLHVRFSLLVPRSLHGARRVRHAASVRVFPHDAIDHSRGDFQFPTHVKTYGVGQFRDKRCGASTFRILSLPVQHDDPVEFPDRADFG